MEGSSAQAICSRRLRRGQIVRALAQLAHSRRRRRRECAAQGRQTCGATNLKLPISLMRGTDLEKPPSCLPSLAADC